MCKSIQIQSKDMEALKEANEQSKKKKTRSIKAHAQRPANQLSIQSVGFENLFGIVAWVFVGRIATCLLFTEQRNSGRPLERNYRQSFGSNPFKSSGLFFLFF